MVWEGSETDQDLLETITWAPHKSYFHLYSYLNFGYTLHSWILGYKEANIIIADSLEFQYQTKHHITKVISLAYSEPKSTQSEGHSNVFKNRIVCV